MQCEYYALEGLSDLVNSIKKVHANLNRDLSIIGLLRVMFDPRVTLQQQVSAQLEAHFGDKVFKAVVPRNVRLAEAPSHGIPGVVFDRSAKGAQAYLAFAKEMIERVKTPEPHHGTLPNSKASAAASTPSSPPTTTATDQGELQTLPAAELQPANTSRAPAWTRAPEELAASIKSQGVMQPILVRPIGGALRRKALRDHRRRTPLARRPDRRPRRALPGAGDPDEAALAMSLIENIRREDLNPSKRPAIQRLIDQFRHDPPAGRRPSGAPARPPPTCCACSRHRHVGAGCSTDQGLHRLGLGCASWPRWPDPNRAWAPHAGQQPLSKKRRPARRAQGHPAPVSPIVPTVLGCASEDRVAERPAPTVISLLKGGGRLSSREL
jgi:hypothetical protein